MIRDPEILILMVIKSFEMSIDSFVSLPIFFNGSAYAKVFISLLNAVDTNLCCQIVGFFLL